MSKADLVVEANGTETTELTILGNKFTIYGTPKEPLFLGADIAKMIDYSSDKVGQMLELVDDNEKLTDTVYREGQNREMWFVTENGLYELLMQSRKPLAKRFKAEVKKMLHEYRMGRLRYHGVIRNDKILNISDARIIFRNFKGEETKFNRKGNRNFCVVIDDSDIAQELINDGWNVRTLSSRDEDEDVKHYIQVTVRFDNVPPKIIMISKNKKTELNEETIGSLDYAEIANIDMTIRPYDWEVNGKTGMKAYLKTMYVTIQQDEFASRYDNIDDGDMPYGIGEY